MWPQEFLARDVPARLADDDREFALEIEILRDARPDDVGKMPGLAVGKAAKHGGVLDFGAAGFLAVRLVIEADAEDLVGIGNDRQPGDAGERMPPGLRRRSRRLGQRAGGDGGLQIGKTIAQERAEVDRFRAIDKAPARGAVDLETCELHGSSSVLETISSLSHAAMRGNPNRSSRHPGRVGTIDPRGRLPNRERLTPLR